MSPDLQESSQFWNDIWEKEVFRNENSDWLKELEEDLANVERQPDIMIKNMLQKQTRKTANWKALGPGSLQGQRIFLPFQNGSQTSWTSATNCKRSQGE